MTTTQANDFVISIYASGIAANTWTAPASTNSRVTVNSTASFRGVLFVDELQASAGVTTSRTASLATSSTLSAISTSIKPTVASTANGNFFFLMR